MKYITLFEQQTAFDNAKSTLDKPNMSLVTETGNVYSLTAGGGGNANVLMFSATGYQLLDSFTFEYYGIEKYDNKEYFKYLCADLGGYILAPTRNITKVTFPFDGYFFGQETVIVPLSEMGFNFVILYGFTSVPENKILMKPRTDIGTNANGKGYVDLGLTSGTLWATMNVGATSETDYGSYFQWGETAPNTTCNWENYKYHGGTQTLTKYNTGLNGYGGTIDNKLTLDLEDDAARVHMEGDWKMPTSALMEELLEETTNEWTTINDVNGRKFTSKADPSKHIFIPASGYRYDSSFGNQGDKGFIWNSSLNAIDPSRAFYLDFGSSNCIMAEDILNRSYGMAVRGVL